MAKSVLPEDRFHNEDVAFEYVKTSFGRRSGLSGLPERRSGQDRPSSRQDDLGRVCGNATPAGSRLRSGWAPFSRKASCPSGSGFRLSICFCASKKGISTRQLQSILGCGMKTARHLGHRIRFAMAPGGSLGPLGGVGKIVEADETELARSRKTKRPDNFRRKTHNPIVMSLVERGGDIRSTVAGSP